MVMQPRNAHKRLRVYNMYYIILYYIVLYYIILYYIILYYIILYYIILYYIILYYIILSINLQFTPRRIKITIFPGSALSNFFPM